MKRFNPRLFFFALILVFIASLSSLIYLMGSLDPLAATLFQFALFYTALFFLTLSVFTLAGYLTRVFTSHNSPLGLYAAISFRQALLLTVLFLILLFLQGLRSINLISIVLLVISLSLLEIAFMSK